MPDISTAAFWIAVLQIILKMCIRDRLCPLGIARAVAEQQDAFHSFTPRKTSFDREHRGTESTEKKPWLTG